MTRAVACALRKNAFESEASMVEQFVNILDEGGSPWGELKTTTEWDYRTGIADVLARTVDGRLVAFEAKLTDWRRASHQAYRNTTYASRVYVVMPAHAAERARAHETVFSKFGIGLCALDASRIFVLIEAPDTEPLLPWLHKRALSFFDETIDDLASRSGGSRGPDLRPA
jgi:hypothetical protein